MPAGELADIRDAFKPFMRGPLAPTAAGMDSREGVAELRRISAAWSAASQHFYAGYALTQAVHLAWGNGSEVAACSTEAMRHYAAAVRSPDTPPFAALVALRCWVNELGMNYVDDDPSAVRAALRGLREELAQRLATLAATAADSRERTGMLARGVQFRTRFDGRWTATFPEHAVEGGITRMFVDEVEFAVSSAFDLFVLVGDYVAADAIADEIPEAFNSHGLRGWRSAVTGFLNPDREVECFTEAAEHFARDVLHEDEFPASGHWSAINTELWARYFNTRATLAEIVRRPAEVTQLIRAAAQQLEEPLGWAHPQAQCLRILVLALDHVLQGESDAGLASARTAMQEQASYAGLDNDDRVIAAFIDSAADAFFELDSDPSRAMTSGRLATALNVLGRIPLVGPETAKAIGEPLGAQALRRVLGTQQTWIYRTLEEIRDEDTLRRLLLRLLQAGLPLYAQIRHGPIEYGKDIVALVEAGGRHIARMYQAKAGDITKSNWAKAKEELEEMHLVAMSELQLPVDPDEREAILVFNGHVNAYAEPVVEAWLNDQAVVFGRNYVLMHLDAIVRWITDGALVNEFRSALTELGIKPAGL